MNFESWMKTVPGEITADSLWKMEAYRLGLFAAELGWHDVTTLIKDRRTLDIAGQLYRALGSIPANLSEGYSRGSGRDRARFYEYALGSAREARGWYYEGRHMLNETVANHRIALLTQIVRLLLAMVPDQRSTPGFLRDATVDYRVNSNLKQPDSGSSATELPDLLTNVPMP